MRHTSLLLRAIKIMVQRRHNSIHLNGIIPPPTLGSASAGYDPATCGLVGKMESLETCSRRTLLCLSTLLLIQVDMAITDYLGTFYPSSVALTVVG